MQNYLDLHRHAAVRAALLGHPGIALRMMVAHAIGGSHLWRVSPEPQTTRNDEVRSGEHTSELQSLMRISYAVFCLKKKKQNYGNQNNKRRNKHEQMTTMQQPSAQQKKQQYR